MSWTYLHEGHRLAYERVLGMIRTNYPQAKMIADMERDIRMHIKLRDEAERAEFAQYGGMKPLQKY